MTDFIYIQTNEQLQPSAARVQYLILSPLPDLTTRYSPERGNITLDIDIFRRNSPHIPRSLVSNRATQSRELEAERLVARFLLVLIIHDEVN